MSDGIDHLDWEVDEGWVPLSEPGSRGRLTHFQIAPGSLSVVADEKGSAVPIVIIMTAVAIPFWLLAAYGLWCLVTH